MAPLRQHSVSKTRKGLLALLLSGAMVAAGSGHAAEPELISALPPPPPDTGIDVMTQWQLDLSDGKYTVEQARKRAASAASGEFNYEGRNKTTLRPLFEHCAQADYSAAQVPERSKVLWENMQVLKESKTIMGPALIDFAIRASIFYCQESMHDNVAGTWSDSQGTVDVAEQKKNSAARLLLTEVHETVHGIQRTTHVGDTNELRSVEELQISELSYEAAARVASIIIALEFKQNGRKDIWVEAKKKWPEESRRILLAYEAALNDMPHAAALVVAGKAGFYGQFKVQHWLNFYNNDVLEAYIKQLARESHRHEPDESVYDIETARKTGWISPAFNFTASLDRLPAYKERFGYNKRMRQAFDYVALEDFAYTLGRDSPAYLAKLKALEKDNNPYLGLDLKKVAAVLGNAETSLEPVEALGCHPGLTDCHLTNLTQLEKIKSPALYKMPRNIFSSSAISTPLEVMDLYAPVARKEKGEAPKPAPAKNKKQLS